MPEHPLERWLKKRMDIPKSAPCPSQSDVGAWQMSLCRETLRHAAANSPFYAERLQGYDLSAIRKPSDLALLPMTTPSDLSHHSEQLLCVSKGAVARAVTLATSGSSGAPKRLFFSADDLGHTAEFFRYGMESIVSAGETVVAMFPRSRPGGVSDLLRQGILWHGAKCILPNDPADIGEAIRLIRTSGASCLVGPPMHLFAIARLWRLKQHPKGQIRSTLLCWDAIPECVRQELKAAFGCQIFTHWGMTETCLGGAVDCASHCGMHLREPDLLAEIIDPQTAMPAKDGDEGELVITTLSRRAMPLIRYRTGDLARLRTGSCGCKTPLRRLADIPGRAGGGIRLKTGARLHHKDISEALLPLGDVLAFTTAYAPHTSGLTVRLYTADGQTAPSGALERLQCIPAIKEAYDRKVLTLAVIREKPGECLPFGFEKHSITIQHKEVVPI